MVHGWFAAQRTVAEGSLDGLKPKSKLVQRSGELRVGMTSWANVVPRVWPPRLIILMGIVSKSDREFSMPNSH